MAAVLFLAPADLGEVVLATGALEYAIQPAAKLSVVCGADAAPLLRAAAGLVATHLVSRAPFLFEQASLWLRLQRGRYDLVIDARGGLLGKGLSGRLVKLGESPILRHRVEQWGEAIGAERAPAPKIWIDDSARAIAAAFMPDTAPLIVLAPGGSDASKRWPRERFASVARRIASGPLQHALIVVLGAASRDAETTRAIVSSLDADGVPARDQGRGMDLLAAAALMERATLVVGNDNALTHVAAAVGAPTLTLFGPTDERVRAPYGPRARTLRGRSLQDIALDAGAAMDDVSVDAVEAAALDLLHAGGLR